MTATDAETRRILEERARLLAQPLADAAADRAAIDLLTFSRAGMQYAVDAAVVVEVVAIEQVTPLVAVPAAIVGVVNHRGRIVAVVDIASLLPQDHAPAGEASLAVVVELDGAWLALQADAVSGIAPVDERDLRPSAELGGGSETVVRALTADMTAILDVEALVHDPRVEVDDQVE